MGELAGFCATIVDCPRVAPALPAELIKRDGQRAPFGLAKIASAIARCAPSDGRAPPPNDRGAATACTSMSLSAAIEAPRKLSNSLTVSIERAGCTIASSLTQA